MADTKEKLVSAAISLLEEGSEEEAGFTMRAIAQRAGVGLGCANYHFGSKERLLAACGNRLAERAMARWEQAVAQNPATGPLRLWGECVFGMLHQAPMAFQTDTAGGASQTGLWDILFPPEVPGAERDGYSGPALGRHARGSAGSLYAQRPPGLRLFSAGGMQGVSGSGFFRATRRRASRLPRSYKEAVIWS